MTLENLRLTLTSANTSLSYDITIIEEATDSQSKDAFSIAPPGLPPSENIFLGVSGMNRDIEIRWAIHDDGTDKSNGTVSTAVTNGDIPSGEFSNDTVVTLAEQVRYLQDYIQAPSFTASWELDHTTGEMYNADGVIVESINTPTIVRDSRKWLNARMQLRLGSSTG